MLVGNVKKRDNVGGQEEEGRPPKWPLEREGVKVV
jgi:hypothetical protein